MGDKKRIREKSTKMPKKAEEARGLELVLLDEVKHEGCPVCSTVASHDHRYFSWFSIETYHEPAFLEQVEASFGFCKRHGAYLDEQGQLGSQLTFVHDFITREACRRLSRQLSGGEKEVGLLFPDPAGCPVCASFEKTATRTVWFFNKLLEEGSAFSDYGHPGILCFPHFQFLARVSAPGVLHRLIPLHDSAIATALNAMDHAGPPQVQAGVKGKICEKGLHLSTGLLFGAADKSYLDRTNCKNPERNPVADFEASLKNGDVCPVCLGEYAAMGQWMGWLDKKIRTADHLDAMLDVLPTCREHVRACVHFGGPSLQFAAVYAALKAAQNKILTAAKQLRRLEEKSKIPLWRRFKKENRTAGGTGALDPRKVVIEPIACPLCTRREVAGERALALLFALLEERRHRTVFEDGYGLCVRHFIQAVKSAPSHDMRTFLARVESAKLARLQWELDETMRKMAWDTRPEQKGSEQTAWHRAIARFSGLPPGS